MNHGTQIMKHEKIWNMEHKSWNMRKHIYESTWVCTDAQAF
eukprot:CAMPEP_0184696908 /NCGR_PEP_ID=MMETSP0313-20130426/4067_1 /TAXON_ID=2792 /ORGANISM="Porphyridium aerugineum, Strain SAG 1380-2" /LENGTH=40 /DNA_ID= /DNA_START= /DNA_END= /DNA_ORIENTATION=